MTIKVKSCKTKVVRYGTARIKNFLTHLPDTLVEVNRRYVEDIAQTLADEVKRRLKRQLYSHVPLSPDYQAWKSEKGLDSRILICTRRYLNHIGVQEIKFPRGYGYRAGVPENVTEKDGTPLSIIMRTHEYGTKKVPARPHWMPVFVEASAKISELRRQGSKNLIKELKKYIKTIRT